MDVEGAEIKLLNTSLLPLLRARRIVHLLFEASPFFWTAAVGLSRTRAAALIGEAVGCGYSMQTVRREMHNVNPISSPAKAVAFVMAMSGMEDLLLTRVKSM